MRRLPFEDMPDPKISIPFEKTVKVFQRLKISEFSYSMFDEMIRNARIDKVHDFDSGSFIVYLYDNLDNGITVDFNINDSESLWIHDYESQFWFKPSYKPFDKHQDKATEITQIFKHLINIWYKRAVEFNNYKLEVLADAKYPYSIDFEYPIDAYIYDCFADETLSNFPYVYPKSLKIADLDSWMNTVLPESWTSLPEEYKLSYEFSYIADSEDISIVHITLDESNSKVCIAVTDCTEFTSTDKEYYDQLKALIIKYHNLDNKS